MFLRAVVQSAEEPVMMTSRTIDTHLEPSRHVALHRLPIAAACEPFRRGGSDLHQDCAHGRTHLHRARVKKVALRSSLGWRSVPPVQLARPCAWTTPDTDPAVSAPVTAAASRNSAFASDIGHNRARNHEKGALLQAARASQPPSVGVWHARKRVRGRRHRH